MIARLIAWSARNLLLVLFGAGFAAAFAGTLAVGLEGAFGAGLGGALGAGFAALAGAGTDFFTVV